MGSPAGTPLTLEALLDLAGESAAEDVRQLTLRRQGITSFSSYAPMLPALEGLSLSHNLLSSLQGLSHLANLASLNVNNNKLASLAGLESCYCLQQLYAANNSIRDLQPLAGLTQLQTLNCMRNAISSLDRTLQVLCQLPTLTELDISINPAATVPNSKSLLVLNLPALQTLDGERLTEHDRQEAWALAEQHDTPLLSSGSLQHRPSQTDILILDAPGAAVVLTTAPGSRGSQATTGAPPDASAAIVSSSGGSGSSCIPATSLKATPPASAGGSPLQGLQRTLSTTQPGQLCATPAALSRPMTASKRPVTAGVGRPGTTGGYTQQLCSDPGLNDHPLLLEYLAKHVLTEGFTSAGQVGALSNGGSRVRGSFADRLRTRATVMAGTEGLGAGDLATNEAVQAALPSQTLGSSVQELLREATPQELIRQLIRLAEVLIRELEALKQHHARCPHVSSRPSSTGSQPRPMSSPTPSGTHADTQQTPSHTTIVPSGAPCIAPGDPASGTGPDRPGSPHTRPAQPSQQAVGPVPVASTPSPGPLAAPGLSTSMAGSLSQPLRPGSGGSEASSELEVEVVRLRREVKQLQLENQNMYWLVDECRNLRAQVAQTQNTGTR